VVGLSSNYETQSNAFLTITAQYATYVFFEGLRLKIYPKAFWPE
jgi:hypothetical protein